MDGNLGRLLARTLERGVWLGALGTTAGVGLVIWGSNETGAASVVLANIGVALMTVGLVGVVYDLLLRRLLVAEVLEVVGIRESVKAFGLLKIGERSGFSLADLLDDATEVTALPLDPAQWIDQDFSTIRRFARDRALKVTLLLPANDAPYVQILAERLGKSEAEVGQILDDAATGKLGDAWDAEPVYDGASFKVIRFGGVPTTGLVMTDKVIAISVGPLIRFRQFDREDIIAVTKRSGSPAARWVDAQIKREQEDENFSEVDDRPLPSRVDRLEN
jgi:hypothetical protein